MDTKEIAEYVDETLTKLYKEQKQAIDDIEKLVLKWWEELFPIMEVMRKHRVHFENPEFGYGETLQGIPVAQTLGDSPCLLVLQGNRVQYVDARTDEVDKTKSLSLKTYIKTADLKNLKTGFDFIRGIKARVDAEEEYTRRLQGFLMENG
jgi:hypothetical protein